MICEQTVKKYCRDFTKIENYDKAIADKTKTWICHHRKEEFFSYKELKERNEYFDVPPEDLILVENKIEHYKLPHKKYNISRKEIGKKTKKPILCVETGIIYDSTLEVERQTKIPHNHISAACKGKLKTVGGFHWQYA